MKWTTAVNTLDAVADRCRHMAAQPSTIVPLRVTSAWVHGDLLGPARPEVPDLGTVRVALVTNVPATRCAWLTRPPGAGQWLAASGLEKRPVVLRFRPADAPVWNHEVERPVLFWSETDGPATDVLAALLDGDGERLRPPAPAPEELLARLRAEQDVGLAAVRAAQEDYAAHRWAPGSPVARADSLAEAVAGYLDVLQALTDHT